MFLFSYLVSLSVVTGEFGKIQKYIQGFPSEASGKEPTCHTRCVRDVGWILRSEDSLEKGMATHSGILAWKIPWTEDPGRL